MTKAELKQLHADARKLVKVLGSRPAPPKAELEARYWAWIAERDREREGSER